MSWPQSNRSYLASTGGQGGGNGQYSSYTVGHVGGGGGGNGQYSSYTVGHVGGGEGGGGQHDVAAGGVKKLLAPSHFNKKTTGGKKVGAGDDVDRYPSSYAYGGASNHPHNGGYGNHRGGYNSGAYGSSPYGGGGGGRGGGGGGGYSNGDSYSSYGGGTYRAGGGGTVIPYNSPATYWSPAPPPGQVDGTRSPMFISTKEVNMYAMPAADSSQYYYGGGYNNDDQKRSGGYNNDDQKRRGGGHNNDDKKRRGGGLFRPLLEAIGYFFDRKFGLHDRD